MNRGSSLSRGSGAHDSDISDIAWGREGEGRESKKDSNYSVTFKVGP